MNEEWDYNQFKVELNNFIIMHGPEQLTIGQAERCMEDFILHIAAKIRDKQHDRETERPRDVSA